MVPSREPILPPEFPLDETPSQANTSAETVGSIEEEKDESSNNSSAIEDIQPYLNEPEIPPSVVEPETDRNEITQESLEQMQTEIITDTAEQMAKARGHERMTTTLNDTMHEDTQVRMLFKPSPRRSQVKFFSIFFVSSEYRSLSVQPKPRHNARI